MIPSRLRLLLAPVLIVVLVAAACGGSDDDSGDATTTTAATSDSVADTTAAGDSVPGTTAAGGTEVDEEYCNVVKGLQDSGNTDYEEIFAAQLEVAPDELRGALETLQDNLDIIEAQPNITSAQRDVIAPPFVTLLSYQINFCGLPFYG